jgi:hypothetical protein
MPRPFDHEYENQVATSPGTGEIPQDDVLVPSVEVTQTRTLVVETRTTLKGGARSGSAGPNEPHPSRKGAFQPRQQRHRADDRTSSRHHFGYTEKGATCWSI